VASDNQFTRLGPAIARFQADGASIDRGAAMTANTVAIIGHCRIWGGSAFGRWGRITRKRNWAIALAGAAIAILVALTAAAQPMTYTFTPIDPPDSIATYAYSINTAGQIVGDFQDNTGGEHGFLYSGGSFTTIDVPGASFTHPYGINTAGQIAGTFAPPPGVHGFLYSGGSFTTIDPAGSARTDAYGINNVGQIVGTFYDGTRWHGFLLDTDGSYTTIDIPGALTTAVLGINDAGQIVGAYSDGSTGHGFVATPVSGSTGPLLQRRSSGRAPHRISLPRAAAGNIQ
jgi:probable HAF family extracellular repeat protein